MTDIKKPLERPEDIGPWERILRNVAKSLEHKHKIEIIYDDPKINEQGEVETHAKISIDDYPYRHTHTVALKRFNNETIREEVFYYLVRMLLYDGFIHATEKVK